MPNDQGPIYLETIMGRFPVEPWNTVSNALFLAIIVYWVWRVKNDVRAHRFIVGALPVLIIGWVGGTVYHATRSHNVWLFMDFVPIALLVMAVSMYFWRRQGVSWLWVPPLVFGPFIMVMTGMSVLDMPDALRPIAGYPILAISILLPVVRYLMRRGWADWPLVVGALAAFVIAVSFRTIDGQALTEALPMGTHWLWHSFGATAVQFLVLYIWRSDLHVAGRAGDEALRPAAAAAGD
jgi:hemolysin III